MTERILLVLESNYFAARLAAQDSDGNLYWDVRRKSDCARGSAPEILEILASILSKSSGRARVMLPLNDQPMFQDFQILGCQWIGYGVSAKDPSLKTWALWGESRSLSFLSLDRLSDGLSEKEGKFERVILETGNDLAHDPRWNVKDYLEFVRSRERYFIGLSFTDSLFNQSPSEGQSQGLQRMQTPVQAAEVTALPRKGVTLSDVLATRISASSFPEESALTRRELELIFQEAFYLRPDGHFPVAGAGGLVKFALHLIVEGMAGLPDGHYTVDPLARTWERSRTAPTTEQIFQAGFAQEIFRNCRAWIALEVDLWPLARKYGNRAYRFGLLSAGALLQTLHLSCTSRGVMFRALGGFDDGMLESLLGLPQDGQRRVFVLAGVAR